MKRCASSLSAIRKTPSAAIKLAPVGVRKQRKRVGGAEEADAMADLWWRAVAFLGALSFSLTLRLLFFSLFHLFHKVKG